MIKASRSKSSEEDVQCDQPEKGDQMEKVETASLMFFRGAMDLQSAHRSRLLPS